MENKWRLQIILLPIIFSLLTLTSAPAFADADANWDEVHVENGAPGSDIVRASNSGGAHEWTTKRWCGEELQDNAPCKGQGCVTDGQNGEMLEVYRDGILLSISCITNGQLQQLGALTVGMVERAFERINWASPGLALNPPHGKAVVNKEVVFSTTLSSQSRTVTLLGMQVTIDANPIRYTWHASPSNVWSTESSGAPYTGGDVSDYIWAKYTTPGRYRPFVEATYEGKYQVDGGPWTALPTTLVKAGAPEPLLLQQARAAQVDAH